MKAPITNLQAPENNQPTISNMECGCSTPLWISTSEVTQVGNLPCRRLAVGALVWRLAIGAYLVLGAWLLVI